jgi:hypothetical protein
MKSEKKNRTVSSGLIIKPLPYPLLPPCYPLDLWVEDTSKLGLCSVYATPMLQKKEKDSNKRTPASHLNFVDLPLARHVRTISEP